MAALFGAVKSNSSTSSANFASSSSIDGIGWVGVNVCNVNAPSTTQISGGSSSCKWAEERKMVNFHLKRMMQTKETLLSHLNVIFAHFIIHWNGSLRFVIEGKKTTQKEIKQLIRWTNCLHNFFIQATNGFFNQMIFFERLNLCTVYEWVFSLLAAATINYWTGKCIELISA